MDLTMVHNTYGRLRNLLLLPRAHNWTYCEWFYSNIDRALFMGENEFDVCLKEYFPGLKVRQMTRMEWCKIRHLLGRPRRCSQVFFDQEREKLATQRAKIRQIQQGKVVNYAELPKEVPLQIVVGTRVTARLRRPQDGIFFGTVEGFDTSNNTYRVHFDRTSLGTHSIPDYEVMANGPVDTVLTSRNALKILSRRDNHKVGPLLLASNSGAGRRFDLKSPFSIDGRLGGFPVKLLTHIVRLYKLLQAKKETIIKLKQLNSEGERNKCFDIPFKMEYRCRYAKCITDLDSINKLLAVHFDCVRPYILEMTKNVVSFPLIIFPEEISERSKEDALTMISCHNNKDGRSLVHNPKILNLLCAITSLLLQLRELSFSERRMCEFKSLKDTMADVKATLEHENLQAFQNKVEMPLNKIIAGLCVPHYDSSSFFSP